VLVKKRSLYIVAVIFLVAILYGFSQYFRTHKSLLGQTPVAEMGMQAVVTAFEEDSSGSNLRYVDKVIAVKGKIRDIQAEENPVIITLGQEGIMSSVQCSMDSAQAKSYRDLVAAQVVTIKGICSGAITREFFGTDVQLIRCVVEEK
jgi:hypothetical protein